MNFCSDNVAGAAPRIVAALAEAAAAGPAMPYGADAWTQAVEARFAEIFETEVAVFLVATGTAANALALAALAPAWGAVYCHPAAHVNVDECGAPELFTGGAKLVGVDGADGKIAAADLERVLATAGAGVQHHVQPAAVSLSQASESGTVYTPEETAAIAAVARAHGLGLHVDGARFANALATLGCSPAEASWRAGVDALSFGATKNGALAAEAVLLFQPALARDFAYRRKRGGHLFSKMRFLAAQMGAYLDGDQWLADARHANAMARALAEGLTALPGARLLHPVQANEVFVTLPPGVADGLTADGFRFYPWGNPADGAVRLVTAFDTDPAHVAAFLDAARRHAGVPAPTVRAG
jgi:threonine aldolase